jgi:hypothetical protein
MKKWLVKGLAILNTLEGIIHNQVYNHRKGENV